MRHEHSRQARCLLAIIESRQIAQRRLVVAVVAARCRGPGGVGGQAAGEAAIRRGYMCAPRTAGDRTGKRRKVGRTGVWEVGGSARMRGGGARGVCVCGSHR